MSDELVKTDNEFIIKRRRKRKIRNSCLLLLFLLAVLFILSIKLPYFNIRNIKVYGNKNIQESDIIKLSRIYRGNNIFYINLNAAEKSIMSNPYIDSVTIKRKLPSDIDINVTERNAVFFIGSNGAFYIIDKNGILLQKKDDISDMRLVKLTGLNVGNTRIGDMIKSNNNRKVDGIKNIGELIEGNKTSFGIIQIDVSDSLNIKAYINNMCIKLGSADDMKEKLNKALNIIEQEKLDNAKGYVDVRFNGNPVFFIDGKQEDK
ncbi:cell division protein FtsQ/DivIB [Clostridium sp. LBM24168]